MGEKKFIIGIAVITIAILIGGVFWATKSTPPSPTQTQKVPDSVVAKLNVREIDWTKGSSTPSAILVEYGDFECPACASYHPLTEQLVEEFPDTFQFVFRNYPLNQHPNSRVAAYAAEAAGMQGKYWEMYDEIFSTQSSWAGKGDAKDTFVTYAKDLGLDVEKFKLDYELQDIKDKVQNDITDANQLGVNSTPTFFLNGEKLQNPASYEDFATLVKAAILKNPISQAPNEKYHTHYNFKVVLNNGQAIDFTQNKYQSTEDKELSEDTHFHDGVGDVVHIHKKGVTLGNLLTSLKMNLTKDCLTLDTTEKFCNTDTEKLRIFVNGKEGKSFETLKPNDLDKILLVYGDPKEDIKPLLDSVADTACIYSEKCPERGKPPTESCVGGLGTDCEEE